MFVPPRHFTPHSGGHFHIEKTPPSCSKYRAETLVNSEKYLFIYFGKNRSNRDFICGQIVFFAGRYTWGGIKPSKKNFQKTFQKTLNSIDRHSDKTIIEA